jgi:spore coat polysaccharide biosynthesis protein SpsF
MNKKDKIVATIEARMTSTRLPGKVLLKAAGKPMLTHLIDRLHTVPSIEEIVLATTVNKIDEELVNLAMKSGVAFYRGSEEDVMGRVVGAADSVSADIVVEITGDCPIIDPAIIEQTIRLFLNNKCDYASNVNIRSYPIGMDTQVFRLSTLKKSYAMTTDRSEQEHVSLHIRRHPELFTQLDLVAPAGLHWPELGLTLDTQDDYILLKKIIEHFGDSNSFFSCKDAIEFLKTNIELADINKHIKRKNVL